MHWLTQELIKPEVYLTTIELYAAKQIKRSNYLTKGLGNIDFNVLLAEKNNVSKLLAKLFMSQQLDFSTLTRNVITRGIKKRTVYTNKTLENIIEGTVSRILLIKLKEYGMPGVYSFFPGSSPNKTLQSISRNLSKLSGDVFVLRSDIVSYTDTIPIDDKSDLWPLLDKFLKWIDPLNQIDDYCYQFIKSRINANFIDHDDSQDKIKIGVPMGRPISTLVAAIYLRDLDILMSDIKKGYYVRFGDDIFWYSNDLEVFNHGDSLFSQKLIEVRLSRNQIKENYMVLTRSGANYTNLDKFIGVREIEYLGLSIVRSGAIRLSLKNLKKIKKILIERIVKSHKLLMFIEDESSKVHIIVKMINQFIQHEFLTRLKSITDRGQLKDLDFFIASQIIMVITRNYHLDVFKKYSYQWLRNDCGLTSLCMLRNNLAKR